jgi:hypothetical protein
MADIQEGLKTAKYLNFLEHQFKDDTKKNLDKIHSQKISLQDPQRAMYTQMLNINMQDFIKENTRLSTFFKENL